MKQSKEEKIQSLLATLIAETYNGRPKENEEMLKGFLGQLEQYSDEEKEDAFEKIKEELEMALGVEIKEKDHQALIRKTKQIIQKVTAT